MSNQPAIRVDERVVIVGPSGSGKSTLAGSMIRQVRPDWPVLIIDPKPAPTIGRLAKRTLQRPAEVAEFTGIARVYRPTFARGAYDDFLDAAWKRRNMLIVIDETRLLLMHGKTDAVVRVLVAGRERGIGCWSLMQRPVILLEAITEAEWAVIFGLQMEQDRARMSERGVSFEGATRLPPHGYMVHRTGWPRAIPVVGHTKKGGKS
jgi:DNA helicase HerA-like ATPase